MDKHEQIVKILVEKGEESLKGPVQDTFTTGNSEADGLWKDLKNYPHAFVLACVMDRQIKAEKAWIIPWEVSNEIGGFEFSRLLKLSEDDIVKIFQKKSLHRFNEVMAKIFYAAIQTIHSKYNDNAANIWNNNPKSATIVRKFLEFKGIGDKISTMAANSLARYFRIPMQDLSGIDISADIHVLRVFKRIGFIPKESTNDELIYKAQKLYPNYPGIFDLPCWEIGRTWCKPQNPECSGCYLNALCEKNI